MWAITCNASNLCQQAQSCPRHSSQHKQAEMERGMTKCIVVTKYAAVTTFAAATKFVSVKKMCQRNLVTCYKLTNGSLQEFLYMCKKWSFMGKKSHVDAVIDSKSLIEFKAIGIILLLFLKWNIHWQMWVKSESWTMIDLVKRHHVSNWKKHPHLLFHFCPKNITKNPFTTCQACIHVPHQKIW